MPKNKKEKTELSKFIDKYYPGERFYGEVLKKAGKILKKGGVDVEQNLKDFMDNKGHKGEDKLLEFKPPAKALIVAQSRPFDQWPIYKASCAIQTYIYQCASTDNRVAGSDKDTHDEFFKKSKLEFLAYRDVQGLNHIFKNANKNYEGVISKVDNRNLKKKNQNKYREEEGLELLKFEEEKAFGDDGKLLHPPGINVSLYCYTNVSPKPIKSILKYNNIPNEYIGYYRKPDEKIEINYINRFLISKDNPGYIPEWQYPLLNNVNSNLRRSHKWYSNHNLKPKIKRKNNVIDRQYKYIDQAKDAKAKESLLCEIKIGEDWLLLDARGLLRNLRWRKIIPREGFSLKEILDQFTGDPIIDTKRGIVTFSYKQGENGVGVHSEKVISYKNSPELIKNCLVKNQDVCLVSVDLGQTNPMAVKFSKITLSQNGELIPETLDRQLLPENLLKEIVSYRDKTDEVRANINELAIAELEQKYKDEFKNVQEDTPDNVISRVGVKLKIDKIDMASLPLDKMSNNTTYISEAYLKTGQDKSIVIFTPTPPKKNKTKVLKEQNRKDNYFAKTFKLQVSKEARQAHSEKSWELQRSSKEYEKLSQRKKEFARRCVNYILSEAKKLSKCKHIIINIENLNVDNRMFSGSGKREVGWENFFNYKKENRWFVQAFHKAFSDLAPHKGICVIKSNPAYTSITCTDCGHCDKNNRNGEEFKCLNCEYEANADLTIATDNLEIVALTGKSMSKPCEQSGDAKSTVGARKTKKANVSEDIGNESNVSFTEESTTQIVKNETTRQPLYKIA